MLVMNLFAPTQHPNAVPIRAGRNPLYRKAFQRPMNQCSAGDPLTRLFRRAVTGGRSGTGSQGQRLKGKRREREAPLQGNLPRIVQGLQR